MSEHTKEPWCIEKFAGQNKWAIGPDRLHRSGDVFREADARHIVACVNACAGISTHDLEVWHANGELLEDLCLRRKDRMRLDMLLSAAKNLRDVKGRHHSEIAMNRLIEAIAEIESSNG